jgi:cytochrome c oxidase accessory protein FixG
MEHKLSKAYPKHQTGTFRSLKNTSSVILQLILFVTPWINWNGRQMLLLDLPGRKFHLFGWTFWPQETHFIFLLLMLAGLTLFFVTTVLGRLWCGYACPQTLFSHSFILVERIIEGDRFKRIKLDKSPWNKDKISKKVAKFSIWLGMSIYLGLTFAGYYTPIRELFSDFVSGSAHASTILVVGFFTVVSMVFFGFFRGRFCSTMCPYARLQGSMFDRDTVMVNYDMVRGEPRGKAKDPDAGSCVDCSLCVQVCPQNIDIRDGVQFECINCAACVDACDSVMNKLGRPEGLVRYASEREIEGGKTKFVRPRPAFYAAALICLVTAFGMLLASRQPLELDAVRDSKKGAFSQSADGRVTNQYNVRLINKQAPDLTVKLSLEGFDKAELIAPTNPLTLPAETSEVTKIFVLVKADDVRPVHHFKIVATDVNNQNVSQMVETTFLRGGI